MKNLALVLMLAVSLAACKTNKQYNQAKADSYAQGQSDAEANAIKAANFMVALQAASGSSSIYYSVVKFAKDNKNFVVISYGSNYAAVDISAYTTGTAAMSYIMSHTVFDKLTANGDGTFSCNAGTCINASGPTSSTMVFEKATTSSKDLEKAAAMVEALNVENMAANIASEFGLSDERSLKVAKLAASWEKLSKTRALTNADADAFSRELTGVSIADMENAEKAMINGSASEMSAVLNKAAEVNGTTSENMSAIMMKLFF